MSSELLKESARKAFHLLTLVYLAAYLWLPHALAWMAAWTVFVGLFETTRLSLPGLNRFLFSVFGGIAREEESRQISGIFHTSLGSTLTVALFGGERAIVVGALLCLALADAAAALAGKRFGRHVFVLRGKKKSLEGSAACFAVALASLLYAGFSALPAVVGALVCAAVEAAPLPINDNSILPVATAATLHLLG